MCRLAFVCILGDADLIGEWLVGCFVSDDSRGLLLFPIFRFLSFSIPVSASSALSGARRERNSRC